MPGLTDIVGADIEVPVLDGSIKRYVNLDNAASTPVLEDVQTGLQRFSGWYSSIHRGSGFKSQVSTWAYEQAKELVLEFLGASNKDRVVIFGKNTTEAINKLANRYPFKSDDVLLTTLMEHHSNDLPWRRRCHVERLDVDHSGAIDVQQLEEKLQESEGRIKLVAVTGASNVTGIINPINEIAGLAHQYGAELFVDAAQLAPHREIRMGKRGEADAIDYLAISAHKMYAPYGTGALIGWPDVFRDGDPDYSGGGTVQIVTEDVVYWREPPDKEEAGSPNVMGAVALGLAIKSLQKIGMQKVAEHEHQLTGQLLDGLQKLPDVEIYGPKNAGINEKLGVVPFNIKGLHHAHVSAILGCEFGVGIRSGCFCAHPYVKHLMDLTDPESDELVDKIVRGERVDLPGLARISFGVYSDSRDVEAVVAAITAIVNSHYQGNYILDSTRGEYWPQGFEPDYGDYFSF